MIFSSFKCRLAHDPMLMRIILKPISLGQITLYVRYYHTNVILLHRHDTMFHTDVMLNFKHVFYFLTQKKVYAENCLSANSRGCLKNLHFQVLWTAYFAVCHIYGTSQSKQSKAPGK